MARELDYKVIAETAGCARFGQIRKAKVAFDLPALSPGIRKEEDAWAVLRNIRAGMGVQVITPYVSSRWSYSGVIPDLLKVGTLDDEAAHQQVLVLPDIESEAFSFNCRARNRYLRKGRPPQPVKMLMRCGLTADSSQKRPEVYSAWRDIENKYTLAGVSKWLAAQYRAVGSDVFFAIGPIIRDDAQLIEQAFDWCLQILDDAMSTAKFTMHGVHLLLHSALFRADSDAAAARAKILEIVGSWATNPKKEKLRGLWLSIKVHSYDELQDSNGGGSQRRILSEFMTELAERVRQAKGALIVHNIGAWGFGMLDSGADVASFRVSGPMRIDVPVLGPRRQPKDLPLFLRGALREFPLDKVRRLYERTGAFPVPACVEPLPYWKLDYAEQVTYSGRVRCGVLVELGQEYRNSVVRDSVPLPEAVRNRVLQSEIRQELIDLCPSLGGTL